nr:MAG TPA: hypothetical protein [Caudoviricetes sp.]
MQCSLAAIIGGRLLRILLGNLLLISSNPPSFLSTRFCPFPSLTTTIEW